MPKTIRRKKTAHQSTTTHHQGPAPTTAQGMIDRIKNSVMAFAAGLRKILIDRDHLAPLVAQAYAQYQQEVGEANASKLSFCKFFGTPEQLEHWPESDKQAKAPGSKTQALFNGVEYLIRRAGQLAKLEKLQVEIQRAVSQAEAIAKVEAKNQHLTGDAAAEYVENAKQAAMDQFAPQRVSQDDIVDILYTGWTSDLDDYSVFQAFARELLGLKYSEKTVAAVMDKTTERIAEAQPVEEEQEVPAQVQEQPLQFRRRVSASA